MKNKVIKMLICFGILLVIAGALAFKFSPTFAENIMSSIFDAKKKLWISSVRNDFKKQEYEKYSRFSMKDNSWIIFAMSHDCCSGEGFNCVISKDSDGFVMIDNKKNFCGVESMCNQLSKIASNSKAEFYNELLKTGLKLEKIDE